MPNLKFRNFEEKILGTSLALGGMEESTMSELDDENLTGLGENDRHLCTDHLNHMVKFFEIEAYPDVLILPHDFLDSGKRQRVVQTIFPFVAEVNFP